MFELIPSKFRALNESHWPSFFTDDLFNPNWPTFKADISETDNAYVIEAELPGFVKDNINVEFRDDCLTISAKKDEAIEEKKNNFIRKERRFGHVMRTFVFDNVDGEAIKAEYKNGVLRLDLPKKEVKSPKIRRIEVN